MINMILIALRYLGQRRLRTVLTILVIVFGIAVIYGTNIMIPAMQTALENLAFSSDNPTLTIATGTNRTATDFTLDEDLPAVRNIVGVESATPAMFRPVILPLEGVPVERRPFVDVLGIESTGAPLESYQLLEGRWLEPGETGVVVITPFIAEVAEVGVGDRLPLFPTGDAVQVIGISYSQETPQQVIVPLVDLQTAANIVGRVNQIEITVSPGVQVMELTARLDETLGVGNYRIASGVNLQASTMQNTAFAVIFNMFGGLALFVGTFLIFITFRTAVIERKNDLAMLRTIGAEREQITRLLLTEGLLQGVIGTTLGILFGQGLAYVLLRALWNISYGQFAPPSMIPVSIPALLISAVVGLVTVLAACYFPARTAGKVSPLEAMRPTETLESMRLGWLRLILGVLSLIAAVALFVVGDTAVAFSGPPLFVSVLMLAPLIVFPVTRLLLPVLSLATPQVADMARANMLRQPWRTSATVNLMFIGFAVFTAIISLLAPMTAASAEQVNSRNPDTDIILASTIMPLGAGDNLETQVRALPNVAEVTTDRLLTTEYQGRNIGILGIEPQYGVRLRSARFEALDLTDEEMNAILATLDTGGNALISYPLNQDTGLQVGDTITLETPNGALDYQIVGVVFEFVFDSMGGAGVVISQDNLAQDFGAAEIISVYINASDQPAIDTTVEAITNQVLTQYPQFYLTNEVERREQMIGDMQRGISIFYVMALLIMVPSVLGLLNTLMINVMERTREIGLMRAIGTETSQVRRMIVSEGLLLGLVGAVMGVIVGLVMGYGVITGLQATDSVQIISGSFELPVTGILIAFVGGMVLVILASLLPARRATRVDIISALRYE